MLLSGNEKCDAEDANDTDNEDTADGADRQHDQYVPAMRSDIKRIGPSIWTCIPSLHG